MTMIRVRKVLLLMASYVPLPAFAAGVPCDKVAVTQPAPFKSVMTIVLSSADQQDAMTDFYLGRLLPLRGYLLTNMTTTESASLSELSNYISLISTAVLSSNESLLQAPTVVDSLEENHLYWRAYLESYQGGCSTASPITSTSGNTYISDHNPFLAFTSIINDTLRCQNIGDETRFASDVQNNNVPNWMLYIPSLEHGGATTTLVKSSMWLQGFLEPLLVNDIFNETLFIVTFDHSRRGGSSIYTLLLGSGIPQFGGRDATSFNHYSILSTVKKVFNLQSLDVIDTSASTLPLVSYSQYYCQKMNFFETSGPIHPKKQQLL
ncbi:hypothetical protein BC830DRAFT_1090483, partial [Chytriomyces sp. MP71]